MCPWINSPSLPFNWRFTASHSKSGHSHLHPQMAGLYFYNAKEKIHLMNQSLFFIIRGLVHIFFKMKVKGVGKLVGWIGRILEKIFLFLLTRPSKFLLNFKHKNVQNSVSNWQIKDSTKWYMCWFLSILIGDDDLLQFLDHHSWTSELFQNC